MSIRQARASDLPQLKALWMEAFQDSAEATDFYFAHRNRYEYLLVEEEQGLVRGMLSMLPIQLLSEGKAHKARYLFAIATGQAFRGQGISTRLMQEAEARARAEGAAATLLVPATPSLFDFYGRRGYETAFWYGHLLVKPEELPQPPDGARLYAPDAGQMLRLRDLAFQASRLYARWDEEALRYVAHAAQVYGAALCAFEAADAAGYAYGEWDGDKLIVKDLALHGIGPMAALALLHQRFQAARYQLRLPEGLLPTPRQPYGMIKAFQSLSADGSPPYLALGKD